MAYKRLARGCLHLCSLARPALRSVANEARDVATRLITSSSPLAVLVDLTLPLPSSPLPSASGLQALQLVKARMLLFDVRWERSQRSFFTLIS